jgi:hypothetical protein
MEVFNLIFQARAPIARSYTKKKKATFDFFVRQETDMLKPAKQAQAQTTMWATEPTSEVVGVFSA